MLPWGGLQKLIAAYIKYYSPLWEFDFRKNSISPAQSCPSPEYPGLQEQLYEPSVFMHIAPALQLNVPKAHSSTSEKKKKYALFL